MGADFCSYWAPHTSAKLGWADGDVTGRAPAERSTPDAEPDFAVQLAGHEALFEV
jgi:hypothetical protein